jgi:hypothetical protein
VSKKLCQLRGSPQSEVNPYFEPVFSGQISKLQLSSRTSYLRESTCLVSRCSVGVSSELTLLVQIKPPQASEDASPGLAHSTK